MEPSNILLMSGDVFDIITDQHSDFLLFEDHFIAKQDL
jgi:hypothetical protein